MSRNDLPTGVSIFKRKADQKARHKPYLISYIDHDGRRRTVKGSTDKDATIRIAWDLHTQAERRRANVTSVEGVHAKRPINEHVTDDIASRRPENQEAGTTGSG